MSIAQLRKQLSDVPGASKLCMRYENGGAVQVFFIDDKEARVSPSAGVEQIRAALLEAVG